MRHLRRWCGVPKVHAQIVEPAEKSFNPRLRDVVDV
jgi:hypothetical protein